jgi:hypothetical protein
VAVSFVSFLSDLNRNRFSCMRRIPTSFAKLRVFHRVVHLFSMSMKQKSSRTHRRQIVIDTTHEIFDSDTSMMRAPSLEKTTRKLSKPRIAQKPAGNKGPRDATIDQREAARNRSMPGKVAVGMVNLH